MRKSHAYCHIPDGSRLNHKPLSISRAIFLDRDGVINKNVHYLSKIEDIAIFPRVAKALNQLKEHYYLIVVTNQSGIARGLLDEEMLYDIHMSIEKRLNKDGASIDAYYFCPHLSMSDHLDYGIICDCRKPKPGMLIRAGQDWNLDLSASFMIGDKNTDVEAGISAGCKVIGIGDDYWLYSDIPIFSDLYAASQWIMDGPKGGL